MKGQYVVAGYQGRLSVRFMPYSSTTVYADHEVASFDNEADAIAYADEHEPAYHADYWDDEGDDYGDDEVDYFACDCCGAIHSKDCKCDD